MRNRSCLLLLAAGLLAAGAATSRGQVIQIPAGNIQIRGQNIQIQAGNIQIQPAGPAMPLPAPGGSQGERGDSIETDQARLRMAFLPTDTTGLVNFFRLRARGEPFGKTLNQLIEALHTASPAARRQAYAELVALGTPALPPLRAAARDAHPHAELVRRCLQTIESDGGTLTVVAAHLLAHRRPPSTVGVLLAYLPHAENETVLHELQDTLNALAYDEKGAADPTMVKALSDKHPLVRLTAVVALTQSDIALPQAPLHKLLLDPVPSVRWRASLALAEAGDPQAISTLIALLGDLADGEACAMIEDFLIELTGELGPKVRLGEGEIPLSKVRDAWAKWWNETDGIGLLDELRKRTVSDADHDKMQTLIQKLGDDNFRVREQTQAELIRLGESVLPLLKQAAKDADLEVRNRSQYCVASIKITQDEFIAKLPVMARLIALRKPPGAAEAILAYLPSLNDDGSIEELQHVLNTVAFSNGKPRPAVLKSLTDKSWIRRAAAAKALCAGPSTDYLEAVRGLLKDPESAVRLKAAVALVTAGDAAAVPALISLVAELPAEPSLQAEDSLKQLARETGPKELPDGEENREKRSKTWAAWWKANKNKVVLVDSRPTMRERFGSISATREVHGYTLLVQPNTNTVTELRPDGKPRWTLTGLSQPRDAQVLPGGQRVLLAEQNRVTERDLRGKILWQKEGLGEVVSVQRLRGGNTFIVCGNQLLEVDRGGKEVLMVPVQLGSRGAARKLRNGQIVAFNGNQVIQLDKTGRVLKSAPVNCGGCGQNEVTDDGHVLALSPGMGHLQEFDADGKQIHDFALPNAGNAFRLPNGHTLVITEGGGLQCVELDKTWKPIKTTTLPAPALRVKRR